MNTVLTQPYFPIPETIFNFCYKKSYEEAKKHYIISTLFCSLFHPNYLSVNIPLPLPRMASKESWEETQQIAQKRFCLLQKYFSYRGLIGLLPLSYTLIQKLETNLLFFPSLTITSRIFSSVSFSIATLFFSKSFVQWTQKKFPQETLSFSLSQKEEILFRWITLNLQILILLVSPFSYFSCFQMLLTFYNLMSYFQENPKEQRILVESEGFSIEFYGTTPFHTQEPQVCYICTDSKNDLIAPSCNDKRHGACLPCAASWANTATNPHCAFCAKPWKTKKISSMFYDSDKVLFFLNDISCSIPNIIYMEEIFNNFKNEIDSFSITLDSEINRISSHVIEKISKLFMLEIIRYHQSKENRYFSQLFQGMMMALDCKAIIDQKNRIKKIIQDRLSIEDHHLLLQWYGLLAIPFSLLSTSFFLWQYHWIDPTQISRSLTTTLIASKLLMKTIIVVSDEIGNEQYLLTKMISIFLRLSPCYERLKIFSLDSKIFNSYSPFL